jgi:topoisomerase-4 subunit A
MRAGRAARRLPEPARQRLVRHCGRQRPRSRRTNAAELCDAALHLIEQPDAPVTKLMEFVQGPDFLTGGIIVDSRASILEAYETGRGGFRVRAKWSQEDQGRGTWSIVVTEIPYGVQKARLIEKIAELLMARKLPLLEDIRDESAEDIRVVLVPKSRSVDPGILMESLFKLTELESRFPLNMNVCAARCPTYFAGACSRMAGASSRGAVRRSKHRLGEIESGWRSSAAI